MCGPHTHSFLGPFYTKTFLEADLTCARQVAYQCGIYAEWYGRWPTGMALDLLVAMQSTGRLCSLLAGCVSRMHTLKPIYLPVVWPIYLKGVGMHDILR